MEDMFDVSEVLYQKFLLDIYRHCDKLTAVAISPEEKEKMALEMVDFVGKVIASLENRQPLVKVTRDERAFQRLAAVVNDRVNRDAFAKSVQSYYVSKRKITRDDAMIYATTAAIAVLSRGKKTDLKTLETRVLKAKPYLFRVASLLSPAVSLHEQLFAQARITRQPKDHLSEDLDAKNFDLSFSRYID